MTTFFGPIRWCWWLAALLAMALAKDCHFRKDVRDVRSKAYISPQVVEGVVMGQVAPVVPGQPYSVTFRITRALRRFRGPGRLRKWATYETSFRRPGAGGSKDSCLITGTILERQKYFLFLSGPQSKTEAVRPILPPLLASRKAKREISRILCKDCAASPEVITGLRDDSAVLGHRVEFSCIIQSNPQSEVSWLKDGKPIKEDPMIDIVTKLIRRRKRKVKEMNKRSIRIESKVVIDAVREKDGGIYSCIGRNVIGNASSQLNLTIVPPLTINAALVLPCPIESYCLNGGTCMLFQQVGEYVCQCVEGFKGYRCQEKEVYPMYKENDCRNPRNPRRSRGLRCPRDQPLLFWELLQQNLASRQKISPWTKAHLITWNPLNTRQSSWPPQKPSFSEISESETVSRFQGSHLFKRLYENRLNFYKNFTNALQNPLLATPIASHDRRSRHHHALPRDSVRRHHHTTVAPEKKNSLWSKTGIRSSSIPNLGPLVFKNKDP